MSFLFRFSKYISVPVFCDWLDVLDLGVSDSAISNHSERSVFLELMRHEYVKCDGLTENVAFDSYVEWLYLRKLLVNEIVIRNSLSKSVVTKCKRCFFQLKSLSMLEYNVQDGPVLLALLH